MLLLRNKLSKASWKEFLSKKKTIVERIVYLTMGLFEMIEIQQSFVYFFMTVPKKRITNSPSMIICWTDQILYRQYSTSLLNSDQTPLD